MVLGTVMLYVIFDAPERIDVFVDNKTPARLIASYRADPVHFIFMSPVAILLATFMALRQMTKWNEITACKPGFRTGSAPAACSLLMSRVSSFPRPSPAPNRTGRTSTTRGSGPGAEAFRHQDELEPGVGGRITVRRFDIQISSFRRCRSGTRGRPDHARGAGG
jgi:hypothetical protein